MKITEDVRKYAAEQSLTEKNAVRRGLEEQAAEFVKRVSEVYAKA
jgi:phosphomethylpyrimidine synthase